MSKKNLSGSAGKIQPKVEKKSAEAAAKKPFNTNILYYFGLMVVLLLSIAIRKNYLEIPFERDEGSYAYCGRIILDGAVTYKDIGSQRLDGVFYAYAMIVAIFGYSVKALHLGFIFLSLASTVLLYFVAKKLTNNIGALAASAFFVILSMTAFASGFTVQSEHIVALLSIAGIFFLLSYFEHKKWWFIVLSGLFFSLAFQVKQTSFFYGLFAGVLLVYKLLLEEKSGFKQTVIAVLLFSFSVFVPIAIDLLMIYKNGAWEDFNLWFFDIRKQYTSVITLDQGIPYLKMTFERIYKDYKIFWIFSFVAPVLVYFTNIQLWKKIAISGFYVFGFLTIVPGYHFYGHYFLQWIPMVALSAAVLLFSIQNILESKLKGFSTMLVLVVLLFSMVSNLNALNTYYFKPNHTQVLREVYGLNPFPESKIVADKLNSVMSENDKIAVFGTEIQMYVYTNKISPSRFAGSGALLEFPVAQSGDWQREFIADVEKAEPRFLVFFSHPISWMANPKTENLIFPWFDQFTAANYRLYGYADMLGNTTNYVWDKDLDMVNNPPKSQYKIFIFERKVAS